MDTEFIEDGKTIDLISIGMVREDGAELYLESLECNLTRASEWVADHVIPGLQGGDVRLWRHVIAGRIREFAGEAPEVWGYFCQYDWVVLCQLFGTMMDLPKGWPMRCLDLRQWLDHRGLAHIEQADADVHHALVDARWAAKTYREFA